ncbi:MAG: hypothetical protein FJ218_06840 [Ignavibacteria bacterium]|nr:hypothetical protein [Ignavibacteria bacterium]
MKHLTEEQIELFVLNAPEIAAQQMFLETHLQECIGCSVRFEEMKSYYTDVETEMKQSNALVPTQKSIERQVSGEEEVYSKRREDWKKDTGPIAYRRIEIALPIRFVRWVVHHPYVAGGGFVGFMILPLRKQLRISIQRTLNTVGR